MSTFLYFAYGSNKLAERLRFDRGGRLRLRRRSVGLGFLPLVPIEWRIVVQGAPGRQVPDVST